MKSCDVVVDDVIDVVVVVELFVVVKSNWMKRHPNVPIQAKKNAATANTEGIIELQKLCIKSTKVLAKAKRERQEIC